MSHKPILTAGGLVLVLAGLALIVPGRPFAQEIQEAQIVKPKIFDETYQLINETDLNYSFYMHEEGKLLPDIRIIGAERMNEKHVFENDDVIYLDKGAADGLEMGQLFLSVGLRAKVGKIGTVMERHGRGRIIYIENDFHIAATNQWALIDMGRQHCVQIGDQLNIFHQARPDLPREAIASAIIIDVRGATAAVKILGARDSVDIGNEEQINVTRYLLGQCTL